MFELKRKLKKGGNFMRRSIGMLLIMVLFLFSCGCKEKKEKAVSESVNSIEAHEDTQQPEPDEAEMRLPEVKYSLNDSNDSFADMAVFEDGSYVISGCRFEEDSSKAIIQLYDENSNFQREYKYDFENGFNEIAVCSDGGLIAISASRTNTFIKLNSRFKIEGQTAFEEDAFGVTVQDLAEISPEVFAVAYVVADSVDFTERVQKLSFFNRYGGVIETVETMKHNDPSDAEIISDGEGGFYLLSSCNESLVNTFPMLSESYDYMKASEAIVMLFSEDRNIIWSKTLGGEGNDWIEEGAIDEQGNIYLAVGTDWYGADNFWDMGVDPSAPFRRMLVKLDSLGNIVYRLPLSNKGMAVDQIFGIHIKDDLAYVIGMTDYFDGYQAKYPCEQIAPEEKGERVFCVYNVCVDSNGDELDRKFFRCDLNDEPCDSEMLPDGAIVIAGSVSDIDNPFNIDFYYDVYKIASIFVYR